MTQPAKSALETAEPGSTTGTGPLRIVLVTAGAILGIEFVIMTSILPRLPNMGETAEGVIDTLLLSLIVSPLLYLFLFKPLQKRLTAEQAAKDKLGSMSQRLMESIHELEGRSREAAIMSEMDDLLQTSRTFEEAYRIIRRTIDHLFPGTAGGVFLVASSRNISELVTSWGDAPPVCPPERCNPEDCWALRKGHIHQVGSGGLSIPCTYATATIKEAYSCVPLVAQGQAIGVMYLISARKLDADLSAKLTTVSRHLALALANLKLNDTLHRQSISDPLTGLFNRRYLQATLDREVHRAERRSQPVAILMVDIDHFKKFNDDFGHEVGDAVLQEVAGLLKRYTRPEDIVCRYGGEEFVVVMPEASLEIAGERAESIRVQTEQLKLVHRGQSVRSVTMSIGVAAYPSQGRAIEDVLKAADAALYQSKAGGRNRVTTAESVLQPRDMKAAETVAA